MLFCAKRYSIPDEEASVPRAEHRQLNSAIDNYLEREIHIPRMATVGWQPIFPQMAAQHDDRCPVTTKPLNSWRNDVWYLK
ncbi:hypothetical protein CEXT_102611 [Caerostris extrusa]|uniref:Uncharacterized protein n=1 Tax=Caerostris extrusa TaxID=172846 RepID=A0AAV4TUV9_CAEEX|nr:hypothetical protein CEXT_102611 [Caerostris extrusa]